MTRTRRRMVLAWVEMVNWFAESDRLIREFDKGLGTWDDLMRARGATR